MKQIFKRTTAAAISLAILSSIGIAKVNPNAPQGGTFIYNLMAEPETLKVTSRGTQYQFDMKRWTCTFLIERDSDNYKPIPGAAKSWEVSKDNLIYTFHLQPNAVFHDGSPVTAEDVKFSFEVVRNPEADAISLLPFLEMIAKIEVLDPLTIRFTMKNPYFTNLEVFSERFYIIPKKIYGDPKTLRTMNKSFVCNGPYKFESWTEGQKLVVKRFDQWFGFQLPQWKGYFNFDKVVFKFIKEPFLRTEAAMKGDLDYAEMRENDIKQIDQKRVAQSASRLLTIESNEPRSLWYVGFNLTRPVFQSKKLRKAFMLLFNRQEIINKIRGGGETIASGPFDPSSPYVSKIKPLPFDPGQAKKLLAEEGWIDTDKDGILDKVVQGVKTKLDFSVYYPRKSDEPWISYFAEDLRKAGIKLNLNFVDGAQYFKKLDNLEHDLFIAGWSEDVPMGDPRIPYHSEGAISGGENMTRYVNKSVDKLFDEARLVTDEKKRIKIYQKIHDLIADDLPMLFAFYNKNRYYYRSNRMGVPADTLNYRTGMETWWIKDLKK